MRRNTLENREKFAQEVSEWLGTPFVHQGHQKQVGADCLGLVIGAYEERFGEVDFSFPDYDDPECARAHSGISPQILEQIFIQSQKQDYNSGDVLVFELKPNAYWHVGVAISSNEIISATQKYGVSKTVLDEFWHRRLHSIFQLEES